MAKSKNTTIIFSAPASVIKEMRWVAKRDRIPPLKDAGYLPSNWGHDLLVSAIHLGDGVFKDITGLETYTEQELRRVDPEFQPKWLPIPGGPRSDGYLRNVPRNADSPVDKEKPVRQLSENL